MKRTNKMFGMITLILGVMLVGAFALGLAGCDNGSGGLTQADKDEVIAWYNEEPADFAWTLAEIKDRYGINLPGNPNSWSGSEWDKFKEGTEKLSKDVGKNDGPGTSGGPGGSGVTNFPFEDEYTDANFPALSGGSDFIGTWKGGETYYIITFESNGTYALKMQIGQTSTTVTSGRFLVSGNNVYLYDHEGGYYLNSWGARTGSTLTLEGGMYYLGGGTWTKQ